MRITSGMMVSNSLRRLSDRLGSYERAQSELAIGRRILRPSDDPSSAGRAMTLKAQLRTRDQEQRNITDARSWLESADSSLQTAMERLSRTRELAIRGSNSMSRSEAEAVALEVDQLKEELVGIANGRFRNRPLFGGFGQADPVQQVGAAWQVGGEGAIARRISETERVTVNVTAAEAFVDPASGKDAFTVLDELSAALRGGDSSAVAGTLVDIDAVRSQIGATLARIGSTTNRVDSADRRNVDAALTIRTELSEVEDVDVAEGVMELQLQQTAYEATLGALGRALPESLVAFLR